MKKPTKEMRPKATNSKVYEQFNEQAMETYGTNKVTKDQAITAGLTMYWSSELCDNGHSCHKYTNNDECRQCRKEYMQKKFFNSCDPLLMSAKLNLENKQFDLDMKRLEKEYDYDI